MKNIESLLVKYLEGNLTKEESEYLNKRLEEDENKVLFKEFISLNHIINSKTKFNYEDELSQFKAKTNTSFKFRSILKYAAAVLIFVSAGYFFIIKDNLVDNNTPIIVNTNIEAGTDKAILTLGDGTNITLEKGHQYISDNLESTGEDLIYKTSQINQTKLKQSIAYNYLTIPRGGQYHVKLSDGTEVWLNSESKLKYPTSFINGEERKIELIYGEAYFDVSPSTNHDGSKFRVLTGIQEIEVLGTEFNVKAYKDEALIYTTLVEGKVAIGSNSQNKKTLNINEQYALNIKTENVNVGAVDVYDIISWKKGVFSFKDKSLEEIMNVLSRWYDVQLIYSNNEAKKILFGGVFKKTQDLKEILQIIENTNAVTFKIEKHIITIK